MKVEVGPGGKLSLKSAQQIWRGDSPDIMQTSSFAGHTMMAIQKSDDEPGLFELHFLGMIGPDFESIESAKEHAPKFAKEVLLRLSEMIAD